MPKVLLSSQVTLHLFENETPVSNIRADRKVSIGGVDDIQTGMSTDQVCDSLCRRRIL